MIKVASGVLAAALCFLVGYYAAPRAHQIQPASHPGMKASVCPACECPEPAKTVDEEPLAAQRDNDVEDSHTRKIAQLERDVKNKADEIANLKQQLEKLEKKTGSAAVCAAVPWGHPANPCNALGRWEGPLPNAYDNKLFEGITLPKATYDINKPAKPTKYRPPRVVHHMLRHLKVLLQDARVEQIDHVKDAVLIEVGAYDGHWTRDIASKSNVKRIYSFEATPSKVQKIKEAFEPCCKDKVVFTNAAVTNYNGTARLYIPRGEAGDVGFGQDSLGNQKFHLGNENFIEVPAVRLDQVVKEHVDMLVSDTQGNEFNVLLGAEKLIDEHGIDIIQFEWSPKLAAAANTNYGDMLHWLWDKGYTCFDGRQGIWDNIPEGIGIDRSLSFFPYLMETQNGPSFQGGWTDLICFKFR